ncbi:MAG: sensor histidine kinase [Myxococcaceae bacterium]
MTVPATLSVTAAVVGLMIALLALGFSAAPGWRELRYFAISAALAGLYSACNVVVTLDVADPVITWFSRTSLVFGGLHAFSWFRYLAAQEGRKLTRFELGVVLLGLAFAALSLWPGALIGEGVSHHDFSALAVTYHDAEPTLLGAGCFAFYSFGLGLLSFRYLVRWRAGVPGASAHFAGLLVFFLAGVNDALAGTRVLRTPYLLDAGFLAVVCAVGGAVTSRFVASAMALKVSSQKLEETQAALVKQERLAALGELSAVVAHEVRNPLVVFNSLASLRRILLPGNPESGALLEIMGEEADRLNRMVNNLLELARPNEPKLAPASLERVLAGAIEAARAAVDPLGEVTVEIPRPLPPVQVDEQMMRQALINLVTNAIQAPKRAAQVKVRVEAEGGADGCVRFEVIDDGAGVPPDLAERIFTPFFTTRAAGTGLGLAVVRRVAEAHRGEVTVHQTPGGGATFVLRLPHPRH